MKLQAIYYGKVQLLPNIYCDSYILNDQRTVLSERGAAELLGMDHTTLRSVVGNWPIKTLKYCIDNSLSVVGNFVEVTAENSYPYEPNFYSKKNLPLCGLGGFICK